MRVAGQGNICDCKIDADCAVQGSADLCVANRVCSGDQCVLGTPPAPCPQSPTRCQVNACDPASGQCALVAVDDGSPCVDGDPCTNDFCLPAFGCYHPFNSAPVTSSLPKCKNRSAQFAVLSHRRNAAPSPRIFPLPMHAIRIDQLPRYWPATKLALDAPFRGFF